jgi:hypothetical protein
LWAVSGNNGLAGGMGGFVHFMLCADASRRAQRTPHPTSLRSATFSHKGRRERLHRRSCKSRTFEIGGNDCAILTFAPCGMRSGARSARKAFRTTNARSHSEGPRNGRGEAETDKGSQASLESEFRDAKAPIPSVATMQHVLAGVAIPG